MNPTSSDHSDGMLPPHNPSVVGSIPTVPTSCQATKVKSLNAEAGARSGVRTGEASDNGQTQTGH
jgi:hypothetical protein